MLMHIYNITLAIDCGPLSNPVNGQVDFSATTHGSSVTYSCASGYILNGASTRTCDYGTWSGMAPLCLHRCM